MKLFMTRGDTLPLKFQRKDTDGSVITESPTKMTFTVKNSWGDRSAIFQKHLANMVKDEESYWHITIAPEDTESLPYGTYVFDIEVVTAAYVCTIAKGELKLTEESTWSVNRG